MTHNRYANHHQVGGRPWTAEEDEQTVILLRAGFRHHEIGTKISRTTHAVKSRIRYLGLTEEERMELLRRSKANRAPVIRMKIEHLYERAPVVPPEVIEDRNQRHLAPRDLTGILCGDPPRGYSALERRA